MIELLGSTEKILVIVGTYDGTSEVSTGAHVCMKVNSCIHPVVLNNPKNMVKYWNLHCNCNIASTISGL